MKRKMRRFLRLIPDFLKLIARLLLDPRVPKANKTILAATFIYPIVPIDLIADFIPFFGMVDDVFLIVLSLSQLLVHAGVEPLRDHWDGEGDIVSMISTVSQVSGYFLPRRIRQYLQEKVQRF